MPMPITFLTVRPFITERDVYARLGRLRENVRRTADPASAARVCSELTLRIP
jgi:hypothetical protein